MKPGMCEQDRKQQAMFGRIDQFICMNHPLVQLAKSMDWDSVNTKYANLYSDTHGQPPIPTRLMVGLQICKYMMNLSDEGVVDRFVHDPYMQFFCGYEVFQWEVPCHSSSLTRWRKRIGDEGAKAMLEFSVDTAKKLKLIKGGDIKRVNIDTTVQEKNVAFPTDARLYFKARRALVREAKRSGVELRQSYERVGKVELRKASLGARVKKGIKLKKSKRRLKTQLRAVINDILRKTKGTKISQPLKKALDVSSRILMQERTDKNKVYSVHEPEVECLSKGKAHKRYEFGNKVSIVSSSRGSWILGAKSFFGNPYDGTTLRPAFEQASELCGGGIEELYADLGYRGKKYHPDGCELILTNKRGLKGVRKRAQKRRSAIEPIIGHLKSDHRMLRNFLKGREGDELNPIFAAAAFNLKKILNHIRKDPKSFLYAFFQKLQQLCKIPQPQLN